MNEMRCAVVTGAASGFGLETIRRLAQDPKYNPIYAVDRNPKILELFPKETFPTVKAVELDVRDSQRTRTLIDEIIGENGAVDLLVNNAGIMISGRVRTFFDGAKRPTEDLRAMWETNIRAPLEIMNQVLPAMRARRSGVIINITSTSPYNRTPHRSVYADFKAVLAGATRIVRDLEAPSSIRVVNVEPGMHKTMLDSALWTEESDKVDSIAAQSMYYWWRRHFAGDPVKVANAIYKIAEGEILDDIVSIGWDSKFASFMANHFPVWKRMFTAGYMAIHRINVLGLEAQNKLLGRTDLALPTMPTSDRLFLE